jgi:hypothetical protein
MLLEEAVLHLLRATGYKTVESCGDDPCLTTVSAGIAVRGRGCPHQIDAIADFLIAQPFGNPQRLLVEAKFYKNRTGLDVVRNGVGVLKDVGEYWATDGGTGPRSRYHYQYAIFSATAYTAPAEAYAFVQDIYLIPVQHSAFMRPTLNAIAEIDSANFGIREGADIPIRLAELRRYARMRLREQDLPHPLDPDGYGAPAAAIAGFVATCRQTDGALLAMLGRAFPVFLVPAPGLRLSSLETLLDVQIFWDENGWYIRRPREHQNLFSFDLPGELFEMFAHGGFLRRRDALDLKEAYFSEFQAIATVDGLPRVLFFRLEEGWIDQVRERVGRRRRRE